MSSYAIYVADDGSGNFTVVAENTPTTLPVGGTRLSIPWLTNANAGSTPLVITSATTATPIVCTTAAHGYTTGDEVFISGGLVMTAINGSFTVTVQSSTTFALDQSVGSGTYTASSATVKRLTKAKDIGTAVQAALRAVLDDRASGN